jgi:hypothetical protein
LTTSDCAVCAANSSHCTPTTLSSDISYPGQSGGKGEADGGASGGAAAGQAGRRRRVAEAAAAAGGAARPGLCRCLDDSCRISWRQKLMSACARAICNITGGTQRNALLAILQAELEREKEVKALEAQRHQQEVEAAAREAEEERRRHREAYLRCVFVMFRAARPALIAGAMAIQGRARSEPSLAADKVLKCCQGTCSRQGGTAHAKPVDVDLISLKTSDGLVAFVSGPQFVYLCDQTALPLQGAGTHQENRARPTGDGAHPPGEAGCCGRQEGGDAEARGREGKGPHMVMLCVPATSLLTARTSVRRSG